MGIDSKYSFKTRAQWHTFWVYNDPEFINEADRLKQPPADEKSLTLGWRKPYMRLADKFVITFDEVYRFKRMGIKSLNRNDVPSVAVYDRKFDWIALYIPKDITEADFRMQWEKVQRVKNQIGIKSSKRKAPANHQLVYAIFKERQKSKTFKQIFVDYQNGRLQYYQGKSKSQYKSEDDLEKYYQTYKPIKLYD